MSEKEAIIEAITGAIGAAAPGMLASAVDSLASKEDDPLVSGVLGIVADFTRQNGTEAIMELGEQLQGLVDGSDPMAAYKLQGSGLYLSDLVDALQDAEAARKERATRMTRAISIALADIGTVLVKAAVVALK